MDPINTQEDKKGDVMISGLTATAGVFGLVLVFGVVLWYERHIDKVKTDAKKEAMAATKLAG